ncbi:MAG TPA: spore coat protein [Candidatus Peribacter riflensis]|uniref:Acylneuraminate cytidylyltransferase n=1 Tax=Candidatus Peribacter riflensis TaxID=1735162 RepID=A0A0S1SW84_9BACT|nr:MAG: acylneuraminate cytidylyltransferase [Candidatus Peribacter riflensis]OGJ78489.1 MAG: hypothetical protein A2398_02500 [Candidatus Peribacteria bacterium RIFOXYB1_FULL_57_12]OGJ82267.1 MAG: hypothetical protein A2412_02640 [Candidatus Peribacteria bacterium RIFOXYC1_FULL_58_8]ALM11422.1 MAG: acylneuraminate cytidylyltransferase [Candidatus Peribacter riflensis]ALM12524.1 MAG: acylneuraminate cytidylyltransferase [Candidatus Peribacter riflensis]
MKSVAIIQGRMSSKRLPGKILIDIEGSPLLAHVIHRAEAANIFDAVIFATSTDKEDDPVAEYCATNGKECFRGDLNDVLERYYQAAQTYKADMITRLTADCPLLDPAVIRQVVEVFDPTRFKSPCYLDTGTDFIDGMPRVCSTEGMKQTREAVGLAGPAAGAQPPREGWVRGRDTVGGHPTLRHDYVSNAIQRTYPDGLDTEVFSMAALTRARNEARLPSEREHVTPYIHRHPELFRIGHVTQEHDLSALRWTVDEPRDLAFVRAIFAELGDGVFGQEEVLALLARKPELQTMNEGIVCNEGYKKSLSEDPALPPS